MDLSQKICVRLTVRIPFPKFFFSIGKKETSRAVARNWVVISLQNSALYTNTSTTTRLDQVFIIFCVFLCLCVCVCVQSVSKGSAHLASCDIQSKETTTIITFRISIIILQTLSILGSFSVIHLQHILSSARQFRVCDLDHHLRNWLLPNLLFPQIIIIIFF